MRLYRLFLVSRLVFRTEKARRKRVKTALGLSYPFGVSFRAWLGALFRGDRQSGLFGKARNTYGVVLDFWEQAYAEWALGARGAYGVLVALGTATKLHPKRVLQLLQGDRPHNAREHLAARVGKIALTWTHLAHQTVQVQGLSIRWALEQSAEDIRALLGDGSIRAVLGTLGFPRWARPMLEGDEYSALALLASDRLEWRKERLAYWVVAGLYPGYILRALALTGRSLQDFTLALLSLLRERYGEEEAERLMASALERAQQVWAERDDREMPEEMEGRGVGDDLTPASDPVDPDDPLVRRLQRFYLRRLETVARRSPQVEAWLEAVSRGEVVGTPWEAPDDPFFQADEQTLLNEMERMGEMLRREARRTRDRQQRLRRRFHRRPEDIYGEPEGRRFADEMDPSLTDLPISPEEWGAERG